jgi:pyruvate,water dikinase
LRGGATPARWVYKWGSWVEQPEDTDIPRAWIEAVIQGIEALAQDVDQPIDAEWVHDGAQLHWVQVREITTFSETDVYSNRISREYFPGIVLPLIWSINVPLVNGAWIRLFTELIGPNDLCADELAHQFYYRAYFNMGAVGHVLELLGMPREGLERMMGLESEGEGTERPRFRPSLRTLRLVPRLLLFLWRKLDVADQVEMFIPTARAQLDNLASADLASLDAPQILDCIDRLYALDQKVAYYNILAPMTMYLSNALLRGWLRRVGLDPEAVDLRGGSVAIQAFDPKVALAQLHASYLQLEPATRDLVLAGDWSGLQMTAGAEPFRRDVHRFLDRFGHLSDSGNDFSVMPWREQPEVVLQMVAGQPAQASGQGQPLDLGRLSWWQRLLLAPAVRRARRALLQREMASSLYTYGYGLFRDYYRALARRLVAQGLLEVVDDIFYLSRERIRDAVINGNTQGLGQEVERVKAEIETVRDVELPAVIYGTEAPPLRSHDSAQSLRGVASSRGRYTGTVRVVQGIADLPRVQQGDVLVVPYSDVGWAPLFARAGALVSQAGGMLSHSSIVARELGIPAVVSVSGAMRLRDGQQVTVDGYRGEIFLLDDETTDQTQVMTQEHEGEV